MPLIQVWCNRHRQYAIYEPVRMRPVPPVDRLCTHCLAEHAAPVDDQGAPVAPRTGHYTFEERSDVKSLIYEHPSMERPAVAEAVERVLDRGGVRPGSSEETEALRKIDSRRPEVIEYDHLDKHERWLRERAKRRRSGRGVQIRARGAHWPS